MNLQPRCAPLTSIAFISLLIAQSLSVLGDASLLVAIISLAKARSGGEGLMTLLQQLFVVPFLVLAPFTGAIADYLPKTRAMLCAVGLKFFGTGLMLAGGNLMGAYTIVGIGAACYSPAKYGILPQLVNSSDLVKANAAIEGSTIIATVFGAVLGGLLADYSSTAALLTVTACYALSVLVTFLIPKLPAEKSHGQFQIGLMILQFFSELKQLFANRNSRLSLIGTSIFLGGAGVLRLLVFAWVPAVFLLSKNGVPANLIATTGVGFVAGAVIASRLISLKNISRSLLPGLLIGPLVAMLAFVHWLPLAFLLVALIGACGGAFVIPLNALLQDNGHKTIGTGRTLAVQNFCENLSVLGLSWLYAVTIQHDISPIISAQMLGGVIFASVACAGYLYRYSVNTSRTG